MRIYLGNLIRLLFVIVIFLCGESYSEKLFVYFNLDFANYASYVKEIVYFVIYLIEFIIIYFLYRREINAAISRFKRKFSSNILQCIMKFMILFLIMIVVNYLCSVVAKSFYLNYFEIKYIPIFNRTLNLDLVLTFLKFIIIIPMIKVIIFTLGVNEIITKNKLGIITSGLFYALYTAYFLDGSLSNVIINVFPAFILFIFLTYNYQKNNHNIIFSMFILILYELLGELLVSIW